MRSDFSLNKNSKTRQEYFYHGSGVVVVISYYGAVCELQKDFLYRVQQLLSVDQTADKHISIKPLMMLLRNRLISSPPYGHENTPPVNNKVLRKSVVHIRRSFLGAMAKNGSSRCFFGQKRMYPKIIAADSVVGRI